MQLRTANQTHVFADIPPRGAGTVGCASPAAYLCAHPRQQKGRLCLSARGNWGAKRRPLFRLVRGIFTAPATIASVHKRWEAFGTRPLIYGPLCRAVNKKALVFRTLETPPSPPTPLLSSSPPLRRLRASWIGSVTTAPISTGPVRGKLQSTFTTTAACLSFGSF